MCAWLLHNSSPVRTEPYACTSQGCFGLARLLHSTYIANAQWHTACRCFKKDAATNGDSDELPDKAGKSGGKSTTQPGKATVGAHEHLPRAVLHKSDAH